MRRRTLGGRGRFAGLVFTLWEAAAGGFPSTAMTRLPPAVQWIMPALTPDGGRTRGWCQTRAICASPPALVAQRLCTLIRRSGAAFLYESVTVSDPASTSTTRASPPFCSSAERQSVMNDSEAEPAPIRRIRRVKNAEVGNLAQALFDYHSAGSHADLHLRDIVCPRYEAILARGTTPSLAQLIS